jgi:CHAT domain-containing protein/tetratricopeptide (TPR) repeat protein
VSFRHTSLLLLLAIAATLFAVPLLNPKVVSAPPDLSPAAEDFRRAEQLYKQGRLAEALPLYQRVTSTGGYELRVNSYMRLTDAYGRLGRLVEAVQAGRNAYALLERSGGPMLRTLDLQLGEAYLGLGHYATAEKYLQRPLAVGETPLALPSLLRGLTNLARCAQGRGNHAVAARFWRQVEELAVAELDRPGTDLPLPMRADYVGRLVDSYTFQHKHAEAIARLKSLLELQKRREDRSGQRDTCRRLAELHSAREEYAIAEDYLRQALEERGKADDAASGVLRGDLNVELAEARLRQGKRTEAAAAWQKSVDSYRAVLKKFGDGRTETVWGVAAFWKLEKLYQRSSQYRPALYLAEEQGDRWQRLALLDPNKVRSEQGALQFLLGAYQSSLPLLRQAVQDFERQEPLNLVDLPRALLNLGFAEYRTADWKKKEDWLKALERAEQAARRALELYRVHKLPDDLVVVQGHHLWGVCEAERGSYHLAIEQFRDGAAVCAKLGRSADPLRSMLLLNMAMLHKSQADLAEASRLCREARKIWHRAGEADELEMAAFDAAEVVLFTAQGRLDEAYKQAQRLLAVCRKHGVEAGPLLEIALHCQGLHELSSGADTQTAARAAERVWSHLWALQEKEKLAPLLPRTLNYLALANQWQGRWEEAESLYRQAAELQQGNKEALAVTHYLSLWGLAGVARHRGQTNEERALLRQAIAVVEAARLGIYGASAERARYFAQFAPSYERLVANCLEAGDVEGALEAATRGRSRTLMDQLRLANLDPRTDLHGTKGAELRRQEEQYRRRLDGLQARARLGEGVADPTRIRQLLAELEQAQRDYAAVWREVLNASPLYRHLSAEDPADKLRAAARDRLLPPKTLLLVYHIGRERSHLLLLGRQDFMPRAFELTMPAARQEKAPIYLTHTDVRALVDHYRRFLESPRFRATAVLRLPSPDPDRSVPPLSLERIANIFLPETVRNCIRASNAECLVVVPDGPLHKLPLEALILKADPKPVYVLDDLPPIVYAPSAALLPLLAERPPLAAGPLTLLTVCNPAYRQARPSLVYPSHLSAQFFAQLPELPFSSIESQRIRSLFPAGLVTVREGSAATETAVKTEIQGKRMVHLAVHGFTDERFGNLYGGLVLTPPRSEEEAQQEDGLLSLHEIYRLPLLDCELAVLSACQTNVGPQHPLEAGVTLASGFLAAGARRVVASHWRVDDEATAAFMEAFFAEVVRDSSRNKPIHYAAALQSARRKVRDRLEWSIPFYWAPFVVVGPPDPVVAREGH